MHQDFMANPDSYKYKTRAFVSQGRLHFLMFKVNNLKSLRGRALFNQQPDEGYRTRIQPLDAFHKGRKVLSVFLETGSSHLNFQELNQSRYTSTDSQMEPTILRCFRDIIAVMYNIGDKKTVFIYKLYGEEFGEASLTFEDRNFLPEYEASDRTQGHKKRFRLRQLLEVDSGVFADSTLHDMFFLEKDTLCLMVGSDMVICKILDLKSDSFMLNTEPKVKYFKVKVRGNDDLRLNVRKFELDRKNECLYYLHGKTISKFEGVSTMLMRYADKMMVAGRIDLRRLKERLSELETDMILIDGDEKRSSIELDESLIDGEASSIELNSSTHSH